MARTLCSLALVVALAAALPPPAHAKKLSPGETIELNAASAEDLARVPGIGKKKAADVVAWRAAHGPFGSIQDLDRVKGFGKKSLQKIAPYLRLGGTAAVVPPPAPDEAPKARRPPKHKKAAKDTPVGDDAPRPAATPRKAPPAPKDEGSGKGDVETL